MLPTPDTSHIDPALTYDPAEDSFLLLDTLAHASERAFLGARLAGLPAPLLVEVGSGSGVVLAFLCAHAPQLLGRPDALALAVDANPHAARATAATVRKALAAQAAGGTRALFLGSAQADLAGAVRAGAADLLVFNPPYVPTPALAEPGRNWAGAEAAGGGGTFEESAALLEMAYAGGVGGMQVTDRFLAGVPRALSPRGAAYVVLCKQNGPAEVAGRVRAWEGGGVWAAEVVGSSGKTGGWEKLCVLRIWRPEPGQGHGGAE